MAPRPSPHPRPRLHRRLLVAGRGAPPQLTIDKPDRFVGQAGTLDVTAGAPTAQLTALAIALEQNGKTIPLFALDGPQTASVTRVDATHVKRVAPVREAERTRAAVRRRRASSSPRRARRS